MTVIALCYAPEKSAPMCAAAAVEVIAGSGIVGDRFFGRKQRHPGQNITLIEAEEINAFNARTGKSLADTDPRRNIITQGVRLNELVGRVFAIGTATFRGVELCEPCSTLARYLAGSNLPKKDFIREFTHRCGLRADIISSGTLRVGDAVLPADVAP
jgi:MOSC domain-containing protein YiiM